MSRGGVLFVVLVAIIVVAGVGAYASLKATSLTTSTPSSHLASTSTTTQSTQTVASTISLLQGLTVRAYCISIAPECSNNTVYQIDLHNADLGSYPMGYSIFLSFNDSTRGTVFSFNSTLPSEFDDLADLIISSASWPAGSNITSQMFPGDQVGVVVSIGSYKAGSTTKVLSCSTVTFTAPTTYTSAYTTTYQTCT